MKDSRIGESLWFEWDGDGFVPVLSGSNIYYTEAFVELDNEVVRKALASSIQRDGLTSSLGEAFMVLNSSVVTYGYVGVLDEDVYQTACDEAGITTTGETLDDILPATWVEVLSF